MAEDEVPVEKAPAEKEPSQRRTRTVRKFPALTFEEARVLPDAIQRYAAGKKVRRLTLFEKLDRAPDSNASRLLVTSSGQYKLTIGGYTAEFLELTPEGKIATGEDQPRSTRLTTCFDLAVRSIAPFESLYEKLKNNKLPAKEVLSDFLGEAEIPEDEREECAEKFILNLTYLGLLRTIGGTERIISIEQAAEDASVEDTADDSHGNLPPSIPQRPPLATETSRKTEVSSKGNDDLSKNLLLHHPYRRGWV